MGGPAARFATPRIPAGALFIDGDRILPGHKAYGNGWDIPGSYVDGSESPATACDRELKEELGVQRQPQRLLIVDWEPHVDEGDKLLYIFDGGDLGAGDQPIQLVSNEPDRCGWAPVHRLPEYVIPRLARRLASAYQAHSAAITLYPEHGRLAPPRAS